MAMGSPISVVIAQIVVQDLKRQILDNKDDFLFWFHYVDDIITCVPKFLIMTMTFCSGSTMWMIL